MYDYWERFKRLCSSCPQHDISEQSLIHYFYEGLLPAERAMVDAASGGSIVNKTPEEARNLISVMAETSQQFGAPQDIPRRVNEVGTSSTNAIESKLCQLTDLVQRLVVNQVQPAKVCGICASHSHFTDSCPVMQDDSQAQVSAMGGFQQQRRYDPYSNTYNPGWRDHLNFRYGTQPQAPNFQNFQPRPPVSQQASTSSKGESPSLEDW